MHTPIEPFVEYPNRQKKPFDPMPRSKRHSRNEIAQILEICRRLLLAGTPTRDIRNGLKVSYGLHKRMSIKYIARARESLIKDLDLPREWHVTDCYNAYKKIAADPASDS